jgi:hypothetical protein
MYCPGHFKHICRTQFSGEFLPNVSLAREHIKVTFAHGDSKLEISIKQRRSSLFAKVYHASVNQRRGHGNVSPSFSFFPFSPPFFNSY